MSTARKLSAREASAATAGTLRIPTALLDSLQQTADKLADVPLPTDPVAALEQRQQVDAICSILQKRSAALKSAVEDRFTRSNQLRLQLPSGVIVRTLRTIKAHTRPECSYYVYSLE